MFLRDPLKNPPVWAGAIERDNASFLSVSSNDESMATNDSLDPIDILPVEIFYMIIEKLDAGSFVNCMHVSNKWKTAVFCLANGDKTNRTWQTIFSLYDEDTFSTKTCGLPYKDLFSNFLLWNMDFSISFCDSFWLKHVKKMSIYRDNTIVLGFEGVTYLDVFKHNIKKSFRIRKCLAFEESDSFVLRITEIVTCTYKVTTKMFLYGKSTMYDDSYESLMETQLEIYGSMNDDNILIVCNVAHYATEENRCYVMNSENSSLYLYTWKDNRWNEGIMGRYYGNQHDNLYAMNVLNGDILLLTKWGQLIAYCYEKRNFQEVHRFRLPPKRNIFIKMVHKYCLVIGVPTSSEFRITRIRNNEGYNHYKFECPNLSCATQHGEMLFLGYNDGKVEIYRPRATTRNDMLRRRFHLTDFLPFDPVVPLDCVITSIDVYEDFERHLLFISTRSVLHQLIIEHDDTTTVWDDIPMRNVYYKFPIRTRYPM